MGIGLFLRFLLASLAILFLPLPLDARGSKDELPEEEIPVEKQLEEAQGQDPDFGTESLQEEAPGQNQDSVNESSQEGGSESTQSFEGEGLQEEVSGQEQDSENGFPEKSDEPEKGPPVPQLIKDGRGKPRLHLYDEEETAILSTNSSQTLVTRADGSFTHILYDNEYRLQSRLVWQEGDTSIGDEKSFFTPSEITSQEDYFYHDNSRNRQKVVLTDFKDTTRRESFYSLEGLLVREELYRHVPDEDTEDKTKEKKDASKEETKKASESENLVSGENGEADEEDLSPKDVPPNPWETFPSLTLVQVTEYQYNQDKSLTEKKITQHSGDGEFVQRTVYHSPGNLHGGFDYFENEQLLVSRKYEDESRYTETRYFDTMRVEAMYSGSRLLAEVVYLDGKELRRTEF